MCAFVGVPRPPEEDAIRLSREASAWITSQVRAAFPGAAETVRLLHGRGYTLNTASGEPSYDLKTYLSTMGLADCFDRLYGPDLVNTFKIGPEFYESLMADAGVAHEDAIFVDDSHEAASWAVEAGARAVVVNAGRPGADSARVRWVATIAEVPAAIEGFD
jgi:phosphoglycolate phosphatase